MKSQHHICVKFDFPCHSLLLLLNLQLSFFSSCFVRQVRAALAPTPPPSYLEIYPDQQVGKIIHFIFSLSCIHHYIPFRSSNLLVCLRHLHQTPPPPMTQRRRKKGQWCPAESQPWCLTSRSASLRLALLVNSISLQVSPAPSLDLEASSGSKSPSGPLLPPFQATHSLRLQIWASSSLWWQSWSTSVATRMQMRDQSPWIAHTGQAESSPYLPEDQQKYAQPHAERIPCQLPVWWYPNNLFSFMFRAVPRCTFWPLYSTWDVLYLVRCWSLKQDWLLPYKHIRISC